MYDNIGEKIKRLAKVCWIIEAICCVIIGIFLMANEIGGDSWLFFGPACIIGGPLAAWVSSWLLYGFGEMIDKLCAIERNTGVPAKSIAFRSPSVAQSPVPLVEQNESGGNILLCPHCWKEVSSDTCGACGKKNNFFG